MFSRSSFRRFRHLPALWWIATTVVAITVGYFVFGTVTKASNEAAKYSDTIDVFVATSPIEAGKSLTSSDYERQSRPVVFAPSRFYQDGTPEGRIATRNLGPGEVLTQESIAPGGTGPIAALLVRDERAVEIETGTVRLDVRPNDRVDVIATFDNNGQSEALILARSARVLTVSSESLTVALPKVEAPAVASAASQRRITIAVSGPLSG